MNDVMKGPIRFIAMLALTTGLASAGVYVEMTDRKVGETGKAPAQKMYVQGNAGRFIDVPGPGDQGHETATIIKDGNLYAIDDTDKTYVLLDKASMETLAKKMNDAMAQVREQLAKMPAEQRAQMEQMLAKQMPGFAGGEQKWTVEAVDTGKNDKVEGRTCRVWDVKRNGELDEQLCVAPFNALPGKENFQAVFGNFARVFEEIATNVPMLAGLMSNEFSAQQKINGFPIRSRDYENGRLSDTERVMTIWREENVPASMFTVPAGYKRKTMEELAAQ